MIARTANSTPPDNAISFLLKCLQRDNYNIPSNFIEASLKIELALSSPLNLFHWVKILPEEYYPTILKVVDKGAFQRWYANPLDPEQYQDLSEAQRNEWDLALFLARHRFPSVLNKEAFEGILDTPARKESLLAWRLKRKPPLSLDVLLNLACLDYPEVASYVAKQLPSDSQLDFAIKAKPNLSEHVMGDPSWLLSQYSRWVDYLSSDFEKSQFSRHLLVTYAENVMQIRDEAFFDRYFQKLSPADQLDVSCVYFPKYHRSDRMHLNLALNRMTAPTKKSFVSALFTNMDALMLSEFTASGIDFVLGLFSAEDGLAVLNSRNAAGVTVFESCAKSDDLLDAIFNRISLPEYGPALLRASPFALMASRYTDTYFQKFLDCLTSKALLGLLTHVHVNPLNDRQYHLFMYLLDHSHQFEAAIKRLSDEDKRRLFMTSLPDGVNFMHLAIDPAKRWLMNQLAGSLSSDDYECLLQQPNAQGFRPLDQIESAQQFVALIRPLPTATWLSYLPMTKKLDATSWASYLSYAFFKELTDDDFLAWLSSLKEPIASLFLADAITQRFLKLPNDKDLMAGYAFNLLVILPGEKQYPFLHCHMHSQLVVEVVTAYLNKNQAEFARIANTPLHRYCLMRESIVRESALSLQQRVFQFWKPAKSNPILTSLASSQSYDDANTLIREFMRYPNQCSESLKSALNSLFHQFETQPALNAYLRPMSTG